MAYYTEEDLRRAARGEKLDGEPVIVDPETGQQTPFPEWAGRQAGCTCCDGLGEHEDGHECYACDASGLRSAQLEVDGPDNPICAGHHGKPDEGPGNAKERYGPDFVHASGEPFVPSESPFKVPMDRFFAAHPGPTHAGVAVQAEDTGRILLLQRSWDETDPEDVRGTWEFPGGSLEEGESVEEGAWREFCEETGCPQPSGALATTWLSPDGVYQGFLWRVPVESEAFEALNPDIDAADTINPDDPERLNPDVTAWFTVEQMRGLGPALRPEVAKMDWSIFDLEAPMDDDTAAEEVAASLVASAMLSPSHRVRQALKANPLAAGTRSSGRPCFGVVAPEGVKSGDRRGFTENALRMRSLPLPGTWQKIAGSGHDGNVVTHIIQDVWRANGMIWFAGEYLDTPEADEHFDLVEKFGRYGISVDADDLDEFSIEMDEDGTTWFTDARMASHCAVSIPAFAEAWMMNGRHADFAKDFAGGWGAPSQPIPTREDEGQAECEHRDEDGNCLDREPGHEEEMATQVGNAENYLRVDDETGEVIGEAEVPDEEEGEPCDPENDPDCVAREDALPEQERPKFKDYTDAEREDAHTLPDGSFPIEDCADLSNAIQAIGRAKDPAKAKAHIRSRKSDLGCPDVELPDTWAAECDDCVKDIGFEEWNGNHVEGIVAAGAYREGLQMKDLAPGLTEDGPGWLTHPVDTDRLRDYWVRGPGAAKIGWGTPDDFYRCEAAVAEYVKPQYLKGYCANRHYDALGYWPGQAPHKGEAIAMTTSAQTQHNGVLVGDQPEQKGPWSLVAAAPKAPADLPYAWFQDPALPMVTPLTVTREGHVFGHLAQWGQCHIGFDGQCVMLPKSKADYSYFRSGVVETDGGEVFTGALTIGGGHADGRLGWRAAMEHYDNTCSVIADIAVGEDKFGVWMSGALREGVTDAQVRELKAAGKASGDWREVVRGSRQLELVAALAVNVGGFPVPRLQIAASGGRVTSLTAAGVVEKDPVDELVEEVAVRLEQRAVTRTAAQALRSKVVAPRLASLRDRVREEK